MFDAQLQVCRTVRFVIFPAVVLALNPIPSSRAGDWPQIMGPNRDGRAEGETLRIDWPKTGPSVVWQKALGEGYAGPAVVDDRVVVFHRVGDVERVEALEAASGRSLWQADFPARYRGGINPDSGPRCVPLLWRDKVFVFGAAGDLYCVALRSGEKIWSRSPYLDYNASEGFFGAGSTPIVADDKLLVNVGGRNGAGLVAFDLQTGKTLWKSLDEQASYSSPTLTQIDGKQYVVFITRLSTCCVDPRDGSLRFRFPFGQRGPTVNAATPLVFDDCLFVSASYGVGAACVKIDTLPIKTIWSGDDIMSSQYSSGVYCEGHLFGTDGREDVGIATLKCVEAKTGKIKWSAPQFGVAHVILVGDKLLILAVDGRLVVADATPTKFRQLASAQIFEDVTRSLPALSNGRLFVRSTSSGAGTLKCLVVGPIDDR